MKEKTQLEKLCRYHRISHNERLEALISIYKDCIYIKIDSVYDDQKPRKKHYDMYILCDNQYLCMASRLIKNGASMKLALKVERIILKWYTQKKFSFDRNGRIIINGGQTNDKQ